MSNVLFLDRDGVVNIDHGYVYKPDEFEFLPVCLMRAKSLLMRVMKLSL